MRAFLFAALAIFLGGCTTLPAAPPADVVAAIAPGGKLRAGINFGNPVLAKRSDAGGELSGITIDLGRTLAQRLGAQFVPVSYPNAGKLMEGARDGEWDVGFAAIDASRTNVVAFTQPYMEVSVTYLVPEGSPVRLVEDADRPGMRIGVGAKNAADLYLSRSIKQAQLVRVDDNVAALLDLLRTGKVDIAAGNREGLIGLSERLGGYRILEGRFYAVEHAMAVPKEKAAALPYLQAFVAEAKRSGAVASALTRHAIRGVDVAQ